MKKGQKAYFSAFGFDEYDIFGGKIVDAFKDLNGIRMLKINVGGGQEMEQREDRCFKTAKGAAKECERMKKEDREYDKKQKEYNNRNRLFRANIKEIKPILESLNCLSLFSAFSFGDFLFLLEICYKDEYTPYTDEEMNRMDKLKETYYWLFPNKEQK